MISTLITKKYCTKHTPCNRSTTKNLYFLYDFKSLTVKNPKWNDKKSKRKSTVWKKNLFKYTRDKRGRSKYTSSIPMLASRVMMIRSCSWLAMQHRDSHTFIFKSNTSFRWPHILPFVYRRHSHSPNWTVQNSNRKFRCLTIMFFSSLSLSFATTERHAHLS